MAKLKWDTLYTNCNLYLQCWHLKESVKLTRHSINTKKIITVPGAL